MSFIYDLKKKVEINTFEIEEGKMLARRANNMRAIVEYVKKKAEKLPCCRKSFFDCSSLFSIDLKQKSTKI